jgi:hypothetical protein
MADRLVRVMLPRLPTTCRLGIDDDAISLRADVAAARDLFF